MFCQPVHFRNHVLLQKYITIILCIYLCIRFTKQIEVLPAFDIATETIICFLGRFRRIIVPLALLFSSLSSKHKGHRYVNYRVVSSSISLRHQKMQFVMLSEYTLTVNLLKGSCAFQCSNQYVFHLAFPQETKLEVLINYAGH